MRNRKLVERLIAYTLIDWFHVQMQELANRSTTKRTFICHLSLNFIITKYLKQEVGDDLSVCVDERSTYGLSVTEDIRSINVTRSNGNDVTTHNEEVSYEPLSRNCCCN